MSSREIALKKAGEFVRVCLESGLTIERAVVFGSSVQGRAHEDSDIDLALVSPDFSRNFIQNNHLTLEAKIQVPEVEVHAFYPEAFTLRNPLVEEILKTGVVIYPQKKDLQTPETMVA